MQTFDDIWARRLALIPAQPDPNKGEHQIGWDITRRPEFDTPYNLDNWGDPTIQDLRELIRGWSVCIEPNDPIVEIDAEGFNGISHFVKTTGANPFYSTLTTMHDQHYLTFYLQDIGVYHLSWYKRRGRIETFIDAETGQPVTLENISDILVALELEKPYAY